MARGAGVVIAIALMAADMLAQQTSQPAYRPVRPTYGNKGAIEILLVQGSVYLLAGAGRNVTLHVGPDAVMVVDTNEAGGEHRHRLSPPQEPGPRRRADP